MTPTPGLLLQMAWATVRAPREAARAVMRAHLPRAERWLALVLFVVVGAILAVFATYLVTGRLVFYLGPVAVTPAVAAVITVTGSVMTVFGIYWIGRAMGGKGGFSDTILLVAWMQFVVVCLQIVQLGVFLLARPLAGLVDIAASVVSLWILTNFVAELHGFSSIGKVLLMIIISLFGVAFAVSIIVTALGFSVVGG